MLNNVELLIEYSDFFKEINEKISKIRREKVLIEIRNKLFQYYHDCLYHIRAEYFYDEQEVEYIKSKIIDLILITENFLKIYSKNSYLYGFNAYKFSLLNDIINSNNNIHDYLFDKVQELNKEIDLEFYIEEREILNQETGDILFEDEHRNVEIKLNRFIEECYLLLFILKRRNKN